MAKEQEKVKETEVAMALGHRLSYNTVTSDNIMVTTLRRLSVRLGIKRDKI